MTTNDESQPSLPSLEERMVAQFGDTISIRELRKFLRLPSAELLKRTIVANDWPLFFPKVGPNYVAPTRDVARCLVDVGLAKPPRRRKAVDPGSPHTDSTDELVRWIESLKGGAMT